MAKGKCAEWTAEISDDSLKELFISDALYSVGAKAQAVAHLKAQADHRLPLIEGKAKQECGLGLLYNPTKTLQTGLGRVRVMIENDEPYAKVHKEVMRIDKRMALPAYRAFCGGGGK
jgi:hypothetical protein